MPSVCTARRDVGVVLAVEVVDGVDHRLRFLRGVGGVEVDQRLAVDLRARAAGSRRARAAQSMARLRRRCSARSCAPPASASALPGAATAARRSAASPIDDSASRQNARVSSARASRCRNAARAQVEQRVSDRAGRRWRHARPSLRRHGSPAPAGCRSRRLSDSSRFLFDRLASLPSAPAWMMMPPWNTDAAAAGGQAAPEQVAAACRGRCARCPAGYRHGGGHRRAARRRR